MDLLGLFQMRLIEIELIARPHFLDAVATELFHEGGRDFESHHMLDDDAGR